jgi:hypothetical protein
MWIKKGLLIQPDKDVWWWQSHAMLPTIDHIKDDLYNVYFSGRDKNNVSQIGCAEVSVGKGEIKLNKIYGTPSLENGQRGCFDDNGVTPSCIINSDNEKKLYYIGWNSGNTTTRMSLIMGLAVSVDGGKTFKRNSRAPLLNPTDKEPFNIATAPCVLKDGESWHMWYVSGEGWLSKDLPIYNIKYAHSRDGYTWARDGHVCIDFESKNETALARPWVVKQGNVFKMWFSYKDPAIGYRIGTATSDNGINWSRNNSSGICVSDKGWDSEMIQYTCVFEHQDFTYMLYNGNNYGENGIGYAIKK